jgi:hypothetical protein
LSPSAEEGGLTNLEKYRDLTWNYGFNLVLIWF